MRRPVGNIAVLGIERIEPRVKPLGIFFIGNSRIDASEPQDGVSWVAVRKYDPVRGGKPGKVIAALDKFLGSLADGRSVFRYCLIKAHRHSRSEEHTSELQS